MMTRWRWQEHKPFPALKAFWQRGRRGWADNDTWDFNIYLSGVLAGGLLYLVDNAHGHPCMGISLEDCKNCECSALWDKELRENVERFKQLHEDNFEGDRWWEEKERVSKEALEWLVKNFGSLWD